MKNNIVISIVIIQIIIIVENHVYVFKSLIRTVITIILIHIAKA